MQHLFSIAGTKVVLGFESNLKVLLGQDKKMCRLELAEKFPKEYIPLHSTLVKGKNYNILITGAHASGKSLLAKHLVKTGFKILANDFTGCWIDGGKLFAGDLNYQYINKFRKPLEVHYLICLEPSEYRDRFLKNFKEFKDFYAGTLPELHPKTIRKFTGTKVFKLLYERHFCLGNRQTIERTILSLNDGLHSRGISRAGIIGMGVIGQSMANLLIGEKWVTELHLYSKTYSKLKGLQLDMESSGKNVKIQIYKSLTHLVKNVDVLILCFNIKNEKIIVTRSERLRKIFPHSRLIKQIAQMMRRANYRGKVIVISNPVDLLSSCLYSFSNVSSNGKLDWQGLLSDQILGIGIGLDYQRMKVLTKRRFEGIEAVGEHGDQLFLAKRNGRTLELYKDRSLLSAVLNYSPNIRKYTDRTIYGPSSEILRVLQTLSKGKGILRVSSLIEPHRFAGTVLAVKNGFLANKYSFSPQIKMKFEEYFGSIMNLNEEVLNSERR